VEPAIRGAAAEWSGADQWSEEDCTVVGSGGSWTQEEERLAGGAAGFWLPMLWWWWVNVTMAWSPGTEGKGF
jgi:hypothetical protein